MKNYLFITRQKEYLIEASRYCIAFQIFSSMTDENFLSVQFLKYN